MAQKAADFQKREFYLRESAKSADANSARAKSGKNFEAPLKPRSSRGKEAQYFADIEPADVRESFIN
jgi:hypothetical protein